MRRGAPACIVVAAVAACTGSPNLSSTEQLAVVVTPGAVTFADPVEVGASSTLVKAIRFSPAAGTGPSFDQITAIVETCADFTVTGPLPGNVKRECAGQQIPAEPQTAHAGDEAEAVTCQSPTITVAEYDVAFHPVTPGAKSCVVTFQGNFGQQAVTVSGTAVPPAFAMRVSPTSIDFGDVRRNTSSPLVQLSILNTGSMPLPISSISDPAGPASPFTISGGSLGPHTLAVGAVETYQLRCLPTMLLPFDATVRVSSPQLPPVDVRLQCTGTDSQLVGPPELVDLLARQHQPITQRIRIANLGTLEANISEYRVEGIPELTLVEPGLIGKLGPGADTEVTVQYAARDERVHMGLGSLVVVHDQAGSGKTSIPISGEALATEVGVDPPAIDFGPVCVGRSATPRPVRVFANLAGHVEILEEPGAAGPLALDADGTPQFPFRLDGNQKSALPLTARFQPIAEGPAALTVTVRTDAPMMATREIGMSGEGIPDGVGAFPRVLDFGALDPGGGIGPGQEVLLSNCTGEQVSVTAVRIEGPHATQFGIASPADPRVTIPAFGRQPYLIVLSPGKPGVKEATLVFEHAAGTTSVPLVGTTIGGGDRRESYYDCSAGGGGAAAWPIGLALAAVLRRRRTRRRPRTCMLG